MFLFYLSLEQQCEKLDQTRVKLKYKPQDVRKIKIGAGKE